MTGRPTVPAYRAAAVPLSRSHDPFGDGHYWHSVDEVHDRTGALVRVLYECRYLIESGEAAAWVTERRWHDGESESRDVEPVG
ncbi:hypothetical protein ACWEKT_02910 [Nocardia takedensis]